MTDNILQVVIQRIVLCGQLRKEQSREVGNSLIGIFQAFGHFTKLAFDLDHTVQDKMGENHEGVLLDDKVGICEALIETFRVLNISLFS